MQIYIGNLAENCTESAIRQLCEPFGVLEAVMLKIHHRTEQSLRFALVTYGSAESAEKAIASLNNSTFQDRPIRVMKAFVRQEPPEIPGDRSDPD